MNWLLHGTRRVILALALVSCLTSGALVAQTGSAAPAPPGAAPAAPAAFDAAKLPEVVATLDGISITRADLQAGIEELRAGMQRMGRPAPPESKEVYQGVLERILAGKLLFREAQALNLVPAAAAVDQEMASMKQQMGGDEAFKQALAAQKITEEQLRADVAENLAIQKLLETKVEPTVQVTDEQSKKFYAENQAQMQQPEGWRASHILIKAAADASAEDKAKAKQKAEGLLAQIKGGADFAKLAGENSDDPGSKAKGGELPWFSKGQTVPAFEQAMTGLKPGEMSGVIESPFGFHIIKLHEQRAARTMPYDEVKERIGDFLKNQGMREALDKHLSGLKAKAKLQVYL